MPTGIDAMLTRRHCLALGAAALAMPAVPAWSAPAATPRLLAAWQCAPQDQAEAARYQIGLLAAQADALVVARALDVPTRAQGQAMAACQHGLNPRRHRRSRSGC